MATRRLRLILTAAAFVAAFTSAPNAFGAPVFVLTGKGYGHGIGLSQYGTQGYAQHGWGYTEILEHYYKGAAVTPGHPNDSVDVLVASGRASVQIASASAFEVAGQALPAGTYTVTPVAGQVSFTDGGSTTVVPSPAEVTPGTAALALHAVMVNRWNYGYAHELTSVWDPSVFGPVADQPQVKGRVPFKNVSIANSDSGAMAYTHSAIAEGYRAIQDLPA